MKSKKKPLVYFTVLLVAVIAISVMALASGDPSDVDLLNCLGLFKGTDNGYELDLSMNRAEAGTMLVRLLGAEATAEAGTWQHPFTDTPDWAEQAMGYMFANGLTQGMTALPMLLT